jgi:hypothetical protein
MITDKRRAVTDHLQEAEHHTTLHPGLAAKHNSPVGRQLGQMILGTAPSRNSGGTPCHQAILHEVKHPARPGQHVLLQKAVPKDRNPFGLSFLPYTSMGGPSWGPGAPPHSTRSHEEILVPILTGCEPACLAQRLHAHQSSQTLPANHHVGTRCTNIV